MRDFVSNELKGATRAFVTANTPKYLWTALRADPGVKDLAERHKGEEIVDWFRYHRATNSDQIIDVATACTLLVALSFKPFDEMQNALKMLDLSGCRWAQFMRQYIEHDILPLTEARLVIPNSFIGAVQMADVQNCFSKSKIILTSS